MASKDKTNYKKELIAENLIFFSRRDFATFFGVVESTIQFELTHMNSTDEKLKKRSCRKINDRIETCKSLLPDYYVSLEKYWEIYKSTEKFWDYHKKMFAQKECLEGVLQYLYSCKEGKSIDKPIRKIKKTIDDYEEKSKKGENIEPCLLYMKAKGLFPKRREEDRETAAYYEEAQRYLEETTRGKDIVDRFVRANEEQNNKCDNVLSLIDFTNKVLEVYFIGYSPSKLDGVPISIPIGWFHSFRTDEYWEITFNHYGNNISGTYLLIKYEKRDGEWRHLEYDVWAVKDKQGDTHLGIRSPKMICDLYETKRYVQKQNSPKLDFIYKRTEDRFSLELKDMTRDVQLKELDGRDFVRIEKKPDFDSKPSIEHVVRSAAKIAFTRDYVYIALSDIGSVIRICRFVKDENGNESRYLHSEKLTYNDIIAIGKLKGELYLAYEIDGDTISINLSYLMKQKEKEEKQEEESGIDFFDYNEDFWEEQKK